MMKQLLSGGPIQHLKKGWAIFPFQGKIAHYWIEDTETMMPQIRDGGRVRYYKSRCGQSGVVDRRVPALETGNFKKCKRCLNGA